VSMVGFGECRPVNEGKCSRSAEEGGGKEGTEKNRGVLRRSADRSPDPRGVPGGRKRGDGKELQKLKNVGK